MSQAPPEGHPEQQPSDAEPFELYLDRHDMCEVFDALLKGPPNTGDPAAAMIAKLEELQLARLGFLNRRSVEGSKVALNKRCVVCTDLSYCGDAALRFRVDMLVKCIKTLALMNAPVVLCFYDDSAPHQEVSGNSPTQPASSVASHSGATGRSTPLTSRPSDGDETPPTWVEPRNHHDDSLVMEHEAREETTGVRMLRERLAAEALQMVLLPNDPADLMCPDLVVAHSNTTILALPNLAGHPGDRVDAPLSFLNPLIAYGDLYVCDALSHMARATLCTTALPRAIGEVVLGVMASQELRGLGPIVVGASRQTANRVLLIGDDDTDVGYSAARRSPPPSSAETASAESSPRKAQGATTVGCERTPLLPRFFHAIENMMNLFDVILVAGTASRYVARAEACLQPPGAGGQATHSEGPTAESALPFDDEACARAAEALVRAARKHNVRVVCAADWVITKRTASGKVRGDYCSVFERPPPRFNYADLGPTTLQRFGKELACAESACMIGQLAHGAREHLGAFLKGGSTASGAASTFTAGSSDSSGCSPSLFNLSYGVLLDAARSSPVKCHTVVIGNSWIDALEFLVSTTTGPAGEPNKEASTLPARGRSAVAAATEQLQARRPPMALVAKGLPASVGHASTMPYEVMADLFGGGMLQSFRQLPQPTAKTQ